MLQSFSIVIGTFLQVQELEHPAMIVLSFFSLRLSISSREWTPDQTPHCRNTSSKVFWLYHQHLKKFERLCTYGNLT
jgi:hypothetical protein